jgi:predicted transcriptional regulator of viral defense system
MIRILKPLKIEEILREKSIRLFSSDEFRRLFGVSEYAAQNFIKNHTKDLFIKLRNGLYASKLNPPTELEIANRLLAPSYISFEYALSRYGIIPESSYSVTSATTRITREFTAQGKVYEYNRIKAVAYRGYRTEKQSGATVLIAEPEKALADTLYFVDLRLKKLNDRLRTSRLKKSSVLRYASLFGRKSLTALAKKVL